MGRTSFLVVISESLHNRLELADTRLLSSTSYLATTLKCSAWYSSRVMAERCLYNNEQEPTFPYQAMMRLDWLPFSYHDIRVTRKAYFAKYRSASRHHPSLHPSSHVRPSRPTTLGDLPSASDPLEAPIEANTEFIPPHRTSPPWPCSILRHLYT